MAASYAKSPLTEATIEFRLSEELSAKDLDRLYSKFAKQGWKSEDLLEIEFTVGPTGPKQRQTMIGRKVTSPDALHVIQILRNAVAVTRSAPYPGWEDFSVLFWSQYEQWRKVTGRRKLGRIGVRYINRLDIPVEAGSIIVLSDYLNFSFTPLPGGVDAPVNTYNVFVASGVVAEGLGVNLTVAATDSPLINHRSFLLDIDVYRNEVDVPQSDPDIHAFLEVVRARKDAIFEACITDKTRQLIS
jgi:uncharacterized protein (TIGR04255 family)